MSVSGNERGLGNLRVLPKLRTSNNGTGPSGAHERVYPIAGCGCANSQALSPCEWPLACLMHAHSVENRYDALPREMYSAKIHG